MELFMTDCTDILKPKKSDCHHTGSVCNDVKLCSFVVVLLFAERSFLPFFVGGLVHAVCLWLSPLRLNLVYSLTLTI